MNVVIVVKVQAEKQKPSTQCTSNGEDLIQGTVYVGIGRLNEWKG